MALPSYEEIVKKAKDNKGRIQVIVTADTNDADYENVIQDYRVDVPETNNVYFSEEIYNILKKMEDELSGSHKLEEFANIVDNLSDYFDDDGNLKTEEEILKDVYVMYEDFEKHILENWEYEELQIAIDEFTPFGDFGPAHTLESIEINIII